jgi:hypothetical protein
MSEQLKKELKRETGHGTDLWRVISAPLIWAAHFLVCYVAAAVFCEKAGRFAGLAPVQGIVAAVTLAALGGIALVFRSLWKVRGMSTVDDTYSFSGNSPEERHRFLSHLAMMLSALSAVAVIYVALPALFLETCR